MIHISGERDTQRERTTSKGEQKVGAETMYVSSHCTAPTKRTRRKKTRMDDPGNEQHYEDEMAQARTFHFFFFDFLLLPGPDVVVLALHKRKHECERGTLPNGWSSVLPLGRGRGRGCRGRRACLFKINANNEQLRPGRTQSTKMSALRDLGCSGVVFH